MSRSSRWRFAVSISERKNTSALEQLLRHARRLNEAGSGRTNVEEIDGHEHDEVDEREDDESPECDGRDQVWDDLVDGATGDRECDCGEGGAFGARGKREDFRWIDPTTLNQCQQ